MNTDPALVCHVCPKAKFARQGLMVCTVDGRDIREHVDRRACPDDRFPPASATCANCWSSAHATADCPIPTDHTKEKSAAGGCGCSAPPVKTLSAMPEPEALSYNPTFSRRRWRVPTLA